MYTADLRITAQYEENYGDSATPYWKMKGGTEFIIKDIEPDPVLYAAAGEADSAIQILLDEKSNGVCRYTLIEWEFIYSEPIELDADAFLFEMGIGMD
jgi:hypothetical protein